MSHDRSKDDNEFANGLPGSLAAERTILGFILLDNVVYHEAAKMLKAEDFAHGAHQKIFRCMGNMIERKLQVDLITLSEEMTWKTKDIEAIGGCAYLSSLTEGLPRNLAIDQYLKIVREKSLLRSLINLCSKAITECEDQSQESIEIGRKLVKATREIFGGNK